MVRVGVTGHRGLPPDTRRIVEQALRELLSDLADHGLVGVSSLADGADQVFADVVLRLGGDLEAVIPAKRYREALDIPGEREAFDHLLSKAVHVVELPFVDATEEAFMSAGQRVVDFSNVLVAVWDGRGARGYGGTADIVQHAQNPGL